MSLSWQVLGFLENANMVLSKRSTLQLAVLIQWAAIEIEPIKVLKDPSTILSFFWFPALFWFCTGYSIVAAIVPKRYYGCMSALLFASAGYHLFRRLRQYKN